MSDASAWQRSTELIAKARQAQPPARAGAWAEAATLFFVLVDERRFEAADAVRWLVREGAVSADRAQKFYGAMRGRLWRRKQTTQPHNA